MSHNASKALMGSTASNIKEVTNFESVSGAVVEAGLAVILESSGKISLDTSEGALLGISLGAGLSDVARRSAVCRKGLRVPLKLKGGYNPNIGEVVAIEDDTGLGIAYTGTGNRHVNAVFASARLGGSGATGGIVEGATSDAGTVGVAYIDFPGGL